MGLSGYLNNHYMREEFKGKELDTKMQIEFMKEAKCRGVVAMHISHNNNSKYPLASPKFRGNRT